MLNVGAGILMFIGAIACCINSCSSSVVADIGSVSSIEFLVAAPQFGSQTLTVDSTSIHYVKKVPNFPTLSRDTVVQDPAFLAATLRQIDIDAIVFQGASIGNQEDGYSVLTIKFRREQDFRETAKVVKYTLPPPTSLLGLHRALSEKMVAIHDN